MKTLGVVHIRILYFLELLHSTTQTLITRTHTHPYEHMYTSPTESAFAPYMGFGVLMTSKLGTNMF